MKGDAEAFGGAVSTRGSVFFFFFCWFNRLDSTPSSFYFSPSIPTDTLPSFLNVAQPYQTMSTLPQVEKEGQNSQTIARRLSTTSSKSTAPVDTSATNDAEKPGPDLTYILRGKKLAVVFIAMLLSLLLVALE